MNLILPPNEQQRKREKESNSCWRKNAVATKIQEGFRKKNESWPPRNETKKFKSSVKRENKKDFKENKRFKRNANVGIKNASSSSKSIRRSVKENSRSFRQTRLNVRKSSRSAVLRTCCSFASSKTFCTNSVKSKLSVRLCSATKPSI